MFLCVYVCVRTRACVCVHVHMYEITIAMPFSCCYVCRRNDFISTVREAAKTALQQIGGPDAERILRVTNILQEEIKQLEGNK